MDNAVKLSLVSDAKVSIAASGGLDSSILFYHVVSTSVLNFNTLGSPTTE